ncbi:sensor histidine kinase [Nonomuraea sp. NPDC046570]|uniref:sensor histidine kinase n=1 Tax=Nonomuraea sp. NPDC046570 TaxID=3155255 RepID=UPI0033CCFFDA
MRRFSGLWLLGAVGPLLVVAGVVVGVDGIAGFWWTGVAAGVSSPLVGAFLLVRRPELPIGRLLLAAGLAAAASTLVHGLDVWAPQAGHAALRPYTDWAGFWLAALGHLLLWGPIAITFTDGLPPARAWRPVLWAVGAIPVLLAAGILLAPGGIDPDTMRSYQPLGLSGVLDAALLALRVLPLVGIGALVHRCRARGPDGLRQVAWFAYPMVVVVLAEAFSGPALATYVQVAAVFAVPVAIAVAVLRHRLYDIDVILNRTLVYAVLTGVIGAVYFGLIGLGNALATGFGSGGGLVAALAAGALFQPVRQRLQALVDRLFKVERDPYKVADRLSQSVQEASGPVEALASAATAIRQALQAEGVAVEVVLPDQRIRTVADGEPGPDPVVTPLVWHGRPVGRLLVAGERPGGALLDMLARHLAEVAHAVRLTADLQSSRERILATREEERRRLRRDLHDGLGPTLASLAMTVDEARVRLARDPEAVAPLLHRVRDQMTEAIVDVRDLVYGLRPPALDDLGLEGAVRTQAGAPGPRVDVVVDGDLDGLPAAVEVAAYRIVQEALTNVRRHAHATTALVRLERQEELWLTVSDDGIGLPEQRRNGVGLNSMRERAVEVGGTCVISVRPGGGTEVTARLPVKGSP